MLATARLHVLGLVAALVIAGCAPPPAPVRGRVLPPVAAVPAELPKPLPAAAPAPPDLAYTLRYVAAPAPAIDVEVEATVPASGRLTFSVVDSYANVSDAEVSIRDVHAQLVDGGTVSVESPTPRSWRVQAPAGARVALRYAIFSTHAPTSADRFRTIVTPHLVHFLGMLALAAPEHLAPGPHTIRFSWEGLAAAGLHPATSFGASATEDVHETLDAFQQSVFMAADDLRLVRRTAGEGVVELAISGHWSFTDDELADRIAHIIAVERTFFEDPGERYFAVLAFQIGDQGYGGSGYTHSFDLAMSPGIKLDATATHLLAHEYFHTWNGLAIHPEAFETLTYWFTEGFTDFYAARLAYRGGLISLDEYAKEVDDEVRAYLTSPVRELPNAHIAGGFWNDDATEQLPYQRGNAIALVVDREIRRATGGRKSLDDVMRALATADNKAITSERVIAMFEGLTSTAFAARVRATAIDGAPLAIPDDVLAPCLVATPTTAWTFDAGFDVAASTKARAIIGLRAGSAAARAGVREGEALHGWSIYNGDPSKPIVLKLGPHARPVTYLPRGRGITVPHFTVGDPSKCDDVLGSPIRSIAPPS